MLNNRILASTAAACLLCARLASAASDDSTLQIDPPAKLPSVAEFTRYFPVFKTWDASAPPIPRNAKHISTRFGLRDFVLIQLTDSKTPYENTKAVIAMSQDGKPASYLTLKGFKNLSADWVTEDVLKVETWPGRAIQIVELIDVNDGKAVYTGAWNHIYAGPPEPRGTSKRSPSLQPSSATIYHNDSYGLTFHLPSDWTGYGVLRDRWQANEHDDILNRDVLAGTGPILILRHPKWRLGHRRQDIPILVFTTEQWKAAVPERIYAGGVIHELCRNKHYVCGIYSRFAAADGIPGAQEAQKAAMQNLPEHEQD